MATASAPTATANGAAPTSDTAGTGIERQIHCYKIAPTYSGDYIHTMGRMESTFEGLPVPTTPRLHNRDYAKPILAAEDATAVLTDLDLSSVPLQMKRKTNGCRWPRVYTSSSSAFVLLEEILWAKAAKAAGLKPTEIWTRGSTPQLVQGALAT